MHNKPKQIAGASTLSGSLAAHARIDVEPQMCGTLLMRFRQICTHLYSLDCELLPEKQLLQALQHAIMLASWCWSSDHELTMLYMAE